MKRFVQLVVFMLTLSIVCVQSVDRSKFRTCADTGFCKRHRVLHQKLPSQVDKAANPVDGNVVLNNVLVENNRITANADVIGTKDPALALDIRFYAPGAVRVRLTESGNTLKPRWESPDILIEDQMKPLDFSADNTAESKLTVSFPTIDGIVAEINYAPFMVDILSKGKKILSLNGRGLLHFEQRHQELEEHIGDAKIESKGPETEDENSGREILDWGEDGKPIYADDGEAENPDSVKEENSETNNETVEDDINGPESFGGHTDTRPHGATSIGIDVSFPLAAQVYGLAEHASDFALKRTIGGQNAYSEPFRLYNLDVFEYELDVPMALYGHVPLLYGHGVAHTAGFFWNNPSETFVDIAVPESGIGRVSHWMSESGVHDAFLLFGPKPQDVSQQYAALTGTTALPPKFALGYHQCRWNYRDERDVSEVNSNFELYDIPYDVLWLDIEHTDGKRYFTWDSSKFPTPERMQEELAATGRKMVTIVDPHIKRDDKYDVHSEATKLGYYIKDQTGKKDFDGWCWPGSSSYLDFTKPEVRDWWATRFSYDNYKGSTPTLYTWNDMNEPSVFNGPEVSMRKDMLSIDGVEHREWHNLYGFYQQMATAQGQISRSPNGSERSFVLSRAFFAGSQRYGAIWTGDNLANWEHLAIASPMLLSVSLTGITFSGADVGGFFGNPDTELVVRWYQAGAFQPFFRAHAHLDTKRREPWLFDEGYMKIIRSTIRTRYTYLPLWYTLFAQSEKTGEPIMKPLWFDFPTSESTFTIDDQWLVGSSLLVKPVVTPNTNELSVYFPGSSTVWYDVVTYVPFQGGSTATVVAKLHQIPVFQKGGKIVPRRMRARRSSSQMVNDPYTLVVALDESGNSAGELYVDDGHTHDYLNGQFVNVSFTMKNGIELTNTVEKNSLFLPKSKVERIVIVGRKVSTNPTVKLSTSKGERELSSSVVTSTNVLTIKVTNLSMFENFTIHLA